MTLMTMRSSNFLVLSGMLPGVDPEDEEGDSVQLYRCRTRNKKQNVLRAHQRSERQYFSEGHMYTEKNFECRFRMLKTLFNRICDALIGSGLIQEGFDAAKKPGIHRCTRNIAALRFLAYRITYDQEDELCERSESESSVRDSEPSFSDTICEALGKDCVRAPTANDLRRILSINK